MNKKHYLVCLAMVAAASVAFCAPKLPDGTRLAGSLVDTNGTDIVPLALNSVQDSDSGNDIGITPSGGGSLSLYGLTVDLFNIYSAKPFLCTDASAPLSDDYLIRKGYADTSYLKKSESGYPIEIVRGGVRYPYNSFSAAYTNIIDGDLVLLNADEISVDWENLPDDVSRTFDENVTISSTLGKTVLYGTRTNSPNFECFDLSSATNITMNGVWFDMWDAEPGVVSNHRYGVVCTGSKDVTFNDCVINYNSLIEYAGSPGYPQGKAFVAVNGATNIQYNGGAIVAFQRTAAGADATWVSATHGADGVTFNNVALIQGSDAYPQITTSGNQFLYGCAANVPNDWIDEPADSTDDFTGQLPRQVGVEYCRQFLTARNQSYLRDDEFNAAPVDLRANTIQRIRNGGTDAWFSDFREAMATAQDDDKFILHGGVYSVVATNTSVFTQAVENVSIVGVGRPRINIASDASDANQDTGISFGTYADGLSISGIDFYEVSTGSAAAVNRYMIVLTGSESVTIDDCRMQWDLQETGSISAKLIVSVNAGTTNNIVRNSGLVARDLGSGNTIRFIASHDAVENFVFENCVFVGEGVDDDDIGSLSELRGCFANDLSLYEETASSVDDQRPFLASTDQISWAMLEGVSSDLTVQTGFDLIRDYYGKNDRVIVISKYLQAVTGVQGPDFSCIPTDFSGKIIILENDMIAGDYDGPWYPDDGVTWHFIYLANDKISTGASNNHMVFYGGSDINIILENFKFKSTRVGGGPRTVFCQTMTNSVVQTINCDFEYTDGTGAWYQPLYVSGSNSYGLQIGGRVMLTDTEFSPYAGMAEYNVLVYTNDTWLANPDLEYSDY